jgi:hypothetical protein
MKIRLDLLATLAATMLLTPLATPAADAPSGKARKVEIRCDTTTGSRIRRDKPEECAKNLPPTVTYQQKDIESTGQTDLGKALKQLDPRFQ